MTEDDLVLNHLKYKGSLTKLDCFKLYSTMCLPQIVHRLKKKGHKIVKVYEHGPKKKWARYSLMFSLGELFELPQDPARTMP